MMFRAEEWGLRGRGTNPCLDIEKNPSKKLARFLDTDELARLGRALDDYEARWPEAIAAVRLLALTGCRRSEVLDLRWRDIGSDALNLADSKTGPRAVPLGKAARAHIEALPGPHDPMRSCSRATRTAKATTRFASSGGRSAPTRSSADCAFMTFGILRLVRPSCPARISPWWASCSGTGGTGPRLITPTSPTGTWLKRRRRLVR